MSQVPHEGGRDEADFCNFGELRGARGIADVDHAAGGQSGWEECSSGKEYRVALVRIGPGQHALLARRSDRRVEFREARTRVAIPYREFRTAPRVQHGVNAADG